MKKLIILFLFICGMAQLNASPYYPNAEARTDGTFGFDNCLSANGVTPCFEVCEDRAIEIQINPLDYISDYDGIFESHDFYVQLAYRSVIVLTTNRIYDKDPNPNPIVSIGPLPAETYFIYPRYYYPGNPNPVIGNRIYVSVRDVTVPPPTISYPTPLCINSDITINGGIWTHSGNPTTSWRAFTKVDFGDGTIEDAPLKTWLAGPPPYADFEFINYTHSYSEPGTYQVRFSQEFQCGTRYSDPVTVIVGPSPSFLSTDMACVGELVSFSNTTNCMSSIDQGTLIWDFGDGKTSTKINPKHSYSSSGNYIVQLQIKVNGDPFTFSTNIQINDKPIVNLGPDQEFCPGSWFSWPTLDARNENCSYEWTFNSEPIGEEGTLETGDFGIYCVTVTNSFGCTATDCVELKEDFYYAPLDANFTKQPIGNWCNPYQLQVSANDTRNGLTHTWKLYSGISPNGSLLNTVSGSVHTLTFVTTLQPASNYYVSHTISSNCDPSASSMQAFNYVCPPQEERSRKRDELHNFSTSLLELETSDRFSIYPNPTKEILNIRGLDSGSDIIIYSLDGKKVLEEQLSTNMIIDVHNLKPGTYILSSFEKNGSRNSEKLIIK